MLPNARRALIIALLGPSIQALGMVWTALHLLLIHWSQPFGPRHLIYEPGVLLVIVGFALTVVCVPVAMEVARASEEDVEIPDYAPENAEGAGEVMRPRPGRLARYSTGTPHPSTGPDQQTQAQG